MAANNRRGLIAATCGIVSVAVVEVIKRIRERKKRLILAQILQRNRIIKVNYFFEETARYMTPRIFRRYFRMYKDTLTELIRFLANSPELQQPPEYTRIPIEKKIAMTCCYSGSALPTLQLAHLFGVAEESFLWVTEEVMDALVSKIHQIIRWPHPNELDLYAAEFDGIGRFFPNVIGAIDDVHLEVKLTEERLNKRSYFCWKQYYSIHLQAVATYDLRFLDIFVGWPGRSHDAKVFRHNPLYNTLPAMLIRHGNNRLIESYHILGDGAYPLSPQVMTPFRCPINRDLNDAECKFNTHLSSKRSNVERSFALLLQRFPRLVKLNQRSLRKKIKVVMSACILHNLCILEKDNVDYYLQRAAQHPRQQFNQQYRPQGTAQSRLLASIKRLQIATVIDAMY